jgi:hypothetical protein
MINQPFQARKSSEKFINVVNNRRATDSNHPGACRHNGKEQGGTAIARDGLQFYKFSPENRLRSLREFPPSACLYNIWWIPSSRSITIPVKLTFKNGAFIEAVLPHKTAKDRLSSLS